MDKNFQRICDECEEDLIQGIISEDFEQEKDILEK